MAYRRPAIEVIQEFQQAAAALALPALPASILGPGFQIVDKADVGIYSEDNLGVTSYPYTGLVAGGIVDLSDVPSTEAEANAHQPVTVEIKDAYLRKVPVSSASLITGKLATPNLFQDATTGAFSSFDPTASGAPAFYVDILGGAGVAAADLGRKLVIGKNSDNELVVAAEWQSGGLPVSNVTYRVLEFRATEDYPNSSFVDAGISASATSVDIDPGLQTLTDTTPLTVVEGTVLASWRALRPDLAAELTVFTDLSSIEAIFGVGSVVPANTGAFAVNLALQNTTTPVNFTGLNGDFFDAIENSYQSGLEFLEGKDVYGIDILTHNAAVHQLLNAHVTQMSDSAVGRERVGFISHLLVDTEVLVPPSGLGVTTSAGSGNGTSPAGNNKTFKDPTNGRFVTDGVKTGYFLKISDYTAASGTQRTVTPNERDFLDDSGLKIQLINANFTAADNGRVAIVKGATSATNDVRYTLSAASGTLATTSPAPAVGEVLPSTARVWLTDLTQTIAHNASDAVVAATKTWTFVNGAFTAADIGRILFIAGAATSGNNGAFVIGDVVSPTAIKTIGAPGGNETFGGGVTQFVYGVNREPGRDSVSDSVVGSSRIWTVLNAAFTSDDVGRELVVAGAQIAGNNATHVIESVISPTQVKTDNSTTPVTEEFNGLLGSLSTLDIVSVTPSATEAAFITGTLHEIDTVVSETQLTLVANPASTFGGTLSAVDYQVVKELSVTEQAQFLAGYATSFANRRLVSTWPDVLAVSVNGTATKVPGYLAGAVLTGLTAGLPSQAGFTNLSLTGFVGRENSDDRFSDTQLDIIAGGGNLVLVQPVAGGPLSVRHQLTTDVSTIFFQEFSVTKNVDLIARFFRGLFQPFLGIYNITSGLLDLLKTRGEGGISFLLSRRAPRVGAPLRAGQVKRIEESSIQPDSVEIDIGISVPLPLNNLKLTLLI